MAHKFKVGDKVKWIEQTSGSMTNGKVYEVLNLIDDTKIQVKDDDEYISVTGYFEYRFKLHTEAKPSYKGVDFFVINKECSDH